MKVESVDATSVTLKMVQKGYSSAELRLKFTQQAGGGVLIENLGSQEPAVPLNSTETYRIEWNTTVPLFQLPAGAAVGLAVQVTKTSVRSASSPYSKYSTYSTYGFTTE